MSNLIPFSLCPILTLKAHEYLNIQKKKKKCNYTIDKDIDMKVGFSFICYRFIMAYDNIIYLNLKLD